MRKKLNSMDVIHVNKNTGEVICETSGCTSIEDETLTENEKKHKEYIDTHVLNFNKGGICKNVYRNGLRSLT